MDIDNKDSSTLRHDTSNQNVGSFGNRLKQARINKNLSLDDVAGELFILRRHLEAIEAEDFKALPQMAFSRGFVINYAKFLGLDPDQIVESFNRNYPDELKRKSVDNIESPLKPMGTLQRDGKRSIRINPLLILGLIGLIILVVFLIRTVSNAQDATVDEKNNTDLVENLSDSEQSAGAAVNTTTSSTGSAINNTGSNLTNTGSALDLGTTDTVNAGTTDTVNANAEPSSLSFWVRNNTDLKVVDATGKTLLSGEQPRGGYKLTGQPPFQIQIEQVSNVDLDLNNEPVKLSEFAQNNKANFSLAP